MLGFCLVLFCYCANILTVPEGRRRRLRGRRQGSIPERRRGDYKMNIGEKT